MPLFEYLCEDCGTKFEKLVRRTAEQQPVACPQCGEAHTKTQFSTFAARANNSAAPRMSGGCPAGMCGTPDLCGRN